MSTQWHVGPAGAVGLKYESLPFVMKAAGVLRKDQAGVFEDIRIMEDAALTKMRETNNKTS